jgi:hypothetical protein
MAGSQLGEDDLALWTSLGVDAAACRCSDSGRLYRAGVLYESFIHPITILSALPSPSVGVLLMLKLFGADLSLVALIGIAIPASRHRLHGQVEHGSNNDAQSRYRLPADKKGISAAERSPRP